MRRPFRGPWNWQLVHAPEIETTTFDLHQAADTYDLFTGTSQDLFIESLVLMMPDVDASDDASLTAVSIHTDDTTAAEFITAAAGAVANLTAEAQLSWTGAILLKAGKKIQATIAGGAADAATVCDIVVKHRPVAMGGYLLAA